MMTRRIRRVSWYELSLTNVDGRAAGEANNLPVVRRAPFFKLNHRPRSGGGVLSVRALLREGGQ